MCLNHITILPIWIDDPLHCSGMIEVWPLRARRCPRPREHQLLSSFFQFLRPPPSLSKLPPSHTSYSFPACSVFPPSLPLLLCHNSSPPLSARLSPWLFVPGHEKEHHDATTLSVLFVLISKVTTPIIFCRSPVFVQFLCFFLLLF